MGIRINCSNIGLCVLYVLSLISPKQYSMYSRHQTSVPTRQTGEAIYEYRKRVKQQRDRKNKNLEKERKNETKRKRELALEAEKRELNNDKQKNKRQRDYVFEKEVYFKEKSTFATKKQKDESIRKFERKCKDIHHKHCKTCHRTGINLQLSSRDLCVDCKKKIIQKHT